jgi:exodeoxyribonuclease III
VRILSWNVNGLRACAVKGFLRWLRASGAAIVAVQEVRARPDQLAANLARPRGWRALFSVAERPGYSGVGVFARRALVPEHVETSLGVPELDREGRYLRVRFGALSVVSAYFPNGNGPFRDNSRIPFKLAFYDRLFDALHDEMRAGGRLLVMGDMNTAHRPIDLARPRANLTTSGFTPVETAHFDALLRRGWVDTFRQVHGDLPGQYTWWSQRKGVRAKNLGWRLDYVLASPAAAAFVRDAFIECDVMGSDHCPVGVELDPGVLAVT